MSDFDYRVYLRETIRDLQLRCLNSFGCSYFSSAYRCRAFLRSKGHSGVLTVCVSDDSYMPMTREAYREWRRLNRELEVLKVK